MTQAGKNLYVQVSVLCLITAVASAFMNNIGALAIMMPVAIHVASINRYPHSYVVMPDSPLIGRTTENLNIRSRYSINLLAVARRDQKIRKQLDKIRFSQGDVLLLQGRSINIDDMITTMKCLPLVERDLNIGKPRQVILALTIFISAVFAVLFELFPVQIAFSACAVVMVLSGVLPVKDLYQHIDWPVIVLLGAMIPVSGALETPGGADLIAGQILLLGDG